jgi:osmotically inducible lipoprotein OsmB
MKKLYKLGAGVLMSVLMLGIGGCTAIGAGVGGATGSAVSHGDPGATVGGAVVGGVIGHEM